ncbi:hypothetical protein DNTS_009131 [Danionella cerebrum]|uniref:Beta-lactamase-related domain-containing protein n=1 Tax=Danionella cerebrum TaxID=2873325 RepID=A0A553QAS3_9TELE|nr:hypothetical protein DNTS_009131 [Danionella translucida]
MAAECLPVREEEHWALKMKVKWTKLGMVFFLLLSCVMTGCFIWQYRLPKAIPADAPVAENVKEENMCPRFPEPVPLQHPIPVLMDALDKARKTWSSDYEFQNAVNTRLNSRIASLSKIFPTLMLYKLWEDGKVDSLDDPLGKYVKNFTVKNPLAKRRNTDQTSRGIKEAQSHISSVTLRRMVSQLSGLPRRLRGTTLLWKGNTEAAVGLLQDDVLVADPGTKCHYSNLAFSLLAHVIAENVAGMDYQQWVSENILQPLGMEDTGFEISPQIQRRMAVGVYSSGQPAPLYDLGWYRPSGQMYSTPADMAKLVMMLLGVFYHPVLQPDTLKTMLTPVFRCETSYFANQTGTPWEVNEHLGYDIIRKDGDLDGFSASVSLVPRLKLGLVILMAGIKPENEDLVAKTYNYLIPAMESAFRNAPRVLIAPPNADPYVGYFTYSNLTFYEIKTDTDGVLSLQQFGPQVESMVPMKYRTLKLSYLQDRVFKVVFENEYPCKMKVDAASVSLESQDGQLFNFYIFNKKGLSPGFDVPGLNTYKVARISRKPVFN